VGTRIGVNVVLALAWPSTPAIATVSHRPALAAFLDSRAANTTEYGDVLGFGRGLDFKLGLGLGFSLGLGVEYAVGEALGATADGEAGAWA